MIELNNKTKQKINQVRLIDITRKFLRAYKKSGLEVSIGLVNDREMTALNKKWRGQSRTTDVLSFGSAGSDRFPGEKSLGEIVISLPQIERQAKERGGDAGRELEFILVHGLLHLVGFCDKTAEEREKMLQEGKEFLKKFTE